MPTYEYACKSCEHRFDIVQSFSEDALTTCPSCEQDALRKVFSAAGIIFKGDGWHIKDYGDKKTSSSTTTVSDDASSSDAPSSKDGAAKSDTAGRSKKKETATSSSESSTSTSKTAASD